MILSHPLVSLIPTALKERETVQTFAHASSLSAHQHAPDFAVLLDLEISAQGVC